MSKPRHLLVELAGFASVGAGLVHAQAAGIHSEHPSSARVFLLLALLQTAAGMSILAGDHRRWKQLSVVTANAAAVGGWILTRTIGIAWIRGLEVAEAPQLADTLCAVLGLLAVLSLIGPGMMPRMRLESSQAGLMAATAAVLVVPAMWAGAGHVHGHDAVPTESAFTIDADGVIISKSTTTVAATTSTSIPAIDDSVPGNGPTAGNAPTRPRPSTPPTSVQVTSTTSASHTHSTTPEQRLAAASGWPRPFDPVSGPDFDGIGGVTSVQEQRARAIIAATARDLARYADPAVAVAAGYRSIGDAATGYEHYLKWSLLDDGRVLDSAAPESLVYKLVGGTKKLVSAMYIAQPGTNMNDPTLVNYAGPLMQWHVHSNLCWRTNSDGNLVVSGLTDTNGNCLFGSPRAGIISPMVHVWVVAHPCGPFAAVEGVAAGVAQASDEERLDLCNRH